MTNKNIKEEKNTASETREKKSNPKRKTKKNTKKSKKKFLVNFIPKTTSEKLLVALFLLLLIAVLILGIKAIDLKKKQASNPDVDLIIPILEKETNDTFLVDLSELKADEIKEYKFMITNYKDEKIAEEDIGYQIDLTKNSDTASIKLYKNGEETNLLTENSSTDTITDNKLSGSQKSSDTYYLIIRAKDNATEKDNISIKITGIN